MSQLKFFAVLFAASVVYLSWYLQMNTREPSKASCDEFRRSASSARCPRIPGVRVESKSTQTEPPSDMEDACSVNSFVFVD